MLQLDPEKRISAQEALKHKFFEDIPEEVKAIYRKKVNPAGYKWVVKGEKVMETTSKNNEEDDREEI